MTEELYGLTEAQHREVGSLVLASRNGSRPAVGVAPKDRVRVNGGVRVMYVDDGYAIYNPREKRKVAVFHLNRLAETKTIEMSGTNLNGLIIITINGVDYTLDCRANTATLREVFSEYTRDCRITAFPGMWEFAWTGSAPEMSAREGVFVNDDGYTGGLLVIDEAWVSEDDGNGGVVMLEVTDAMPFLEGQIRRGARAIAHWSRQDGWLVGEWVCRPFSFRSF